MEVKKSLFFKSFKDIDLKLLYAILIDAGYYLLVFGIIMLTYSMLQYNFTALDNVMPVLEKIQTLSIDGPGFKAEAEEAVGMLRMMFMKGVLIAVGAVIVLVLVSAVLRSLVWSQILRIKVDKHYLKRFFLLKVLWSLAWLLVIALGFLLFKPKVSVWILIVTSVIYVHFTVILHSLFDKRKANLGLIKSAFLIGLKKIYLLIVPYIVAGAVFYFLGSSCYLAYLLKKKVVLMSIYAILFIVFSGWVRLYISMILKKAEKA
ncbi:hypothetical protein KY360_05400 [Candidatus Woesearchaeota archaeon]|nr:hypothetical protein [Candidatus Woesearchaeota archaeon]